MCAGVHPHSDYLACPDLVYLCLLHSSGVISCIIVRGSRKRRQCAGVPVCSSINITSHHWASTALAVNEDRECPTSLARAMIIDIWQKQADCSSGPLRTEPHNLVYIWCLCSWGFSCLQSTYNFIQGLTTELTIPWKSCGRAGCSSASASLFTSPSSSELRDLFLPELHHHYFSA